jgi:hypothetical protein
MRKPNPADREQLERTALHEAGHAVAFLRLGLPFHKASITRHKHSLGRVSQNRRIITEFDMKAKAKPGDPDFDRAYFEHRIMICFAGPVADGRDIPSSPPTRGNDDLSNAMRLIEHIEPDTTKDGKRLDLWVALWLRTQKLIDQHRHDVTIIARLLLEHETITYERAAIAIGMGGLFGTSPSPRPFHYEWIG